MLRKILIAPARFYQLVISPVLPPTCRFHPSCSQYYIDAVLKYGVLKGTYLGIKRILKCNPFHKGGFDYLK
ncbi:MAG: membrane protein insertion efficiency factor YidD [Nitrospinae bacterium]|nr:membrane protein insertion efficiency factor YidD [Nitrospinota bacterium]